MKYAMVLFCCAFIGMVSHPMVAQSAPKEVKQALGSANLQGQTTARYWGFRLYDAELWTAAKGRFDKTKKFALSLRYRYAFTAEILAKSSVEEIARVEGGKASDHKKLKDQLVRCLTDVDDGDRVTGVAESATKATMYVNGRKSCTMSYPRLRDRFFGIWLAPTSRDAKGAARLRGKG